MPTASELQRFSEDQLSQRISAMETEISDLRQGLNHFVIR
jgi:hypothetical protein